MNHRGVEFSVVEAEAGLWRWQFRIGNAVTSGRTRTSLKGLAARRVQQRIDRVLNKAQDLSAKGATTRIRRVLPERPMEKL